MWLSLNDAFLSFVSKDCARDEVLVRARRKGDIEKIFPKAKVTRYTKSDYLYRAAVKRDEVKKALAGEVDRVTYDNFKSSVADIPLHNAYLRVWTAMAALQEVKPYSGGYDFEHGHQAFDFDSLLKDDDPYRKRPVAKKKSTKKLTKEQ